VNDYAVLIAARLPRLPRRLDPPINNPRQARNYTRESEQWARDEFEEGSVGDLIVQTLQVLGINKETANEVPANVDGAVLVSGIVDP